MTTQSTSVCQLQSILQKNQGIDFSNRDVTQTIFHTLEFLQDLPTNEDLNIVKKALGNALDQTALRLALVSNIGFYKTYFDMLPDYTKREEAFEILNKEYENYFGEPKFKNYKAFRKALGF